MAGRTGGRGRTPRRRRTQETSTRVRAAAARAVDQVLASSEAFALLVQRLEDSGWRVERKLAPPGRQIDFGVTLDPSDRVR